MIKDKEYWKLVSEVVKENEIIQSMEKEDLTSNQLWDYVLDYLLKEKSLTNLKELQKMVKDCVEFAEILDRVEKVKDEIRKDTQLA